MATGPKVKLVYFDLPGLGEAIRLVCHYGKLNWEDHRLTGEEFTDFKAHHHLAFGQLPALVVYNDDGSVNHTLFQSAAILRFVGKYAGMYPVEHNTNDNVFAAQIDALLDQEKDMFASLNASRYRQRFGFGCLDVDTVAQVRKALNDEVLPRHLRFFENFLEQSSTGYLLNTATPTIADFAIVPRLVWLTTPNLHDGISEDILEPFPLLKQLIDKVMAIPEVVDFYQKSPPLK